MKHFSFDSRVSTTYVPLQPPYQIIKYGKEIGMQIGTLIATVPALIEEDSSFRIETHSFPVVTYGNKEKAPRDKNLFNLMDFSEGVVWNRVELREVSTICLSDSHLTWQEFIDFLWRDVERTPNPVEPHVESLSALCDLGVKTDPLPEGTHDISLSISHKNGHIMMVRSAYDDILALDVVWQEDMVPMAKAIENQITEYRVMTLFVYKEKCPLWNIKFTTEEDRLMPLVDLLNNPDELHRMMGGYFEFKGIQTIKINKSAKEIFETAKEEKPELQWEEIK